MEPKARNISLSSGKYLNKSDLGCLMTSKGHYQLHQYHIKLK